MQLSISSRGLPATKLVKVRSLQVLPSRNGVRMTLNLIKLCVGCDSIDHLARWQRERVQALKKRGAKVELTHTTRMVPKRTEELLDGGSLYWVIKGIVSV